MEKLLKEWIQQLEREIFSVLRNAIGITPTSWNNVLKSM